MPSTDKQKRPGLG